MNNWKTVKLGEILNFRRGHDLPQKEMLNGYYPVVASNGILGFHSAFTTKAPCITIGRSGNVGKPYYYNCNCWAHNTTLYIDNYKGSFPKFIYYLLKTLNLQNYKGGSAVPTLNRNHIHPISIFVNTNYNEQKAIADVLSGFDDKIELNNKIIKNLEEQAQALYKHWFVDFEFPNEEGKPYKSSGGEFKDSELGPIPKDWEEIKLNTVLDFKKGVEPGNKNYKNLKINENYIKFYRVGEMMNTTNLFVSKNHCNNVYCQKNDVLVSFDGTVGRVAYGLEGAYSSGIRMISSNKECFPSSVIYFLFLSEYIQKEIKKYESSRTTIVHAGASVNDFVIVFKEKTYALFAKKINNSFANMIELKTENQKLAEMRDYLLPKLMCGEIRVKVGGN